MSDSPEKKKIFLFKIFVIFSLPVLTHCSFVVPQYENICEENKNIWTVGEGNRSLQAIVNCDCDICLEKIYWCEGPKKSCKSNKLGQRTNATKLCQNSTLKSVLEFSETVDKPMKNFFYAFRDVSDVNASHHINITIMYCPRKNSNSVTITIEDFLGSENSSYGAIGTFTCPRNEHLIDTKYNKTVMNATTTCGKCAKWDKMDEMDCWRAPNVSLNLTNFNKTFNVDGKLTSKICTIHDPGKPPAANPMLSLSKSKGVIPPLVLQAEHNNKSIYCVMNNQLTKILGTDAGFSQGRKLLVQFGPTEVWNQTTCTPTDEELGLFNMTLNVSFSANPPLRNVKLSGLGNTSIFTDKLTYGSIGCCGVKIQHYIIVVTNVTIQDKITFLYHHQIKNYSGIFSCADIIPGTHPIIPDDGVVTTSQTESEHFSTTEAVSIPFPVIIAVSGGILLIIAITILCVLIKRRKKLESSQIATAQPPSPECQDGVEKLNILYDTSYLRSSGNAVESVENVLYGSSSGTTDVYAAVVKPKKNDSGTDSPSTSGLESEVTYAMVNKKQKANNSGLESEATYAMVNKKPKPKKSGREKKAGGVQEDQTYAVVDKNRKKQ